MAIAMNRIGGTSNTGDGHEDPKRCKPMVNDDSNQRANGQVASALYGVTNEYLVIADENQAKRAQGANPW